MRHLSNRDFLWGVKHEHLRSRAFQRSFRYGQMTRTIGSDPRVAGRYHHLKNELHGHVIPRLLDTKSWYREKHHRQFSTTGDQALQRANRQYFTTLHHRWDRAVSYSSDSVVDTTRRLWDADLITRERSVRADMIRYSQVHARNDDDPRWSRDSDDVAPWEFRQEQNF